MERRFIAVLGASAVFILLLLLLDSRGGAVQVALGAATAAFLWLVVRYSAVAPAQVICCILVATLGEVVLSLGWGLYEYQHALIPLYVPPGHGLFYTLAAATAKQEALLRRAKEIVVLTLVAGSIVAAIGLAFLNDVWGFLWWMGAVVLIRYSRNQLLLAACFAYTLVLEWLGTAIGNWTWAAEVPFVGLPSANPPSGVGILYILLDLIVVGVSGALIGRFAGGRTPPEDEALQLA